MLIYAKIASNNPFFYYILSLALLNAIPQLFPHLITSPTSFFLAKHPRRSSRKSHAVCNPLLLYPMSLFINTSYLFSCHGCRPFYYIRYVSSHTCLSQEAELVSAVAEMAPKERIRLRRDSVSHDMYELGTRNSYVRTPSCHLPAVLPADTA